VKFSVRVFEFDNYRNYLKELYRVAKMRDPKFSFRYFSRVVGSKSPSFIKQVIDGERNLTVPHIEKLIGGLGLSDDEGFFFKNLVLLNQAKTVEEKQAFVKKLLQSREYRKLHQLSAAQYQLFSRWFYIALREMVALRGFKENHEWISKQFKFNLSPEQVKVAISELLKLGMLKRNSDGILSQSESHVTTVDGIISSALAQGHRELIAKGIHSIDLVPREERDILGVTFSLSKKNIGVVKEKVANFRRELVEYLSSQPDADSVYQFHLLLFPLAQITESESEKRK
jgi:uncharacterized protein (TIGR02147 family)